MFVLIFSLRKQKFLMSLGSFWSKGTHFVFRGRDLRFFELEGVQGEVGGSLGHLSVSPSSPFVPFQPFSFHPCLALLCCHMFAACPLSLSSTLELLRSCYFCPQFHQFPVAVLSSVLIPAIKAIFSLFEKLGSWARESFTLDKSLGLALGQPQFGYRAPHMVA